MLADTITDQMTQTDKNFPEVSIIMPCLNEADTLATCIRKAKRALSENNIDGEIIVADNGSTDESQTIAVKSGARLIHVREKGYGSALMGGIVAARGNFIIMGDADESYDFLEAPKFVERLRAGDDLVQGCRLPAGGGTVNPHRARCRFSTSLGESPVLAWRGGWFARRSTTVYCGLRAFQKATVYERLDYAVRVWNSPPR